jgi:hypothetical protein
MAKKIYVCTDVTARDVAYEASFECGMKADNVQDAIDALCYRIKHEINDKYFSMAFFVPLQVWEVEHNLDKMVSVTLEDLDGNDMEGDVEYKDMNTVLVRFSQPVSGWVYCN